MGDSRIGDLTERELEVMRLVARNRGSHEIARALNISTETVQTHIKRARAKVGGIDRYALANAVAAWEGRPQSIGTPEEGMEPAAAILPDAIVSKGETRRFEPEALREERAVFDMSEDRSGRVRTSWQGVSVNDLNVPQRLGRIGTIAFQMIAGLATVLLAMSLLQRLFQGG